MKLIRLVIKKIKNFLSKRKWKREWKREGITPTTRKEAKLILSKMSEEERKQIKNVGNIMSDILWPWF